MAEEVQVSSPQSADKEKGEPTVVDLPAPEGWKKKYFPKKKGTPRRYEVIFVAPTGEEIKTRTQLDKYLRSHAGSPPISEFNWSTGDTPRRSTRLTEKAQAESETPDSQSKKRASDTEQKKKAPKRSKKTDADAEETKQANEEAKIDENPLKEEDEQMKDAEKDGEKEMAEAEAAEKEEEKEAKAVKKENENEIVEASKNEDLSKESKYEAEVAPKVDEAETEAAVQEISEKALDNATGGANVDLEKTAEALDANVEDAKMDEKEPEQNTQSDKDPSVTVEEVHKEETVSEDLSENKNEHPIDHELKERAERDQTAEVKTGVPEHEVSGEAKNDCLENSKGGYENGLIKEPVASSYHEPQCSVNAEDSNGVANQSSIAPSTQS
eukprot:TRINITY_DN1356_c0_g1_i2.p1 TRINITY_DN1356_c0_g1~~TRINITY_DN1356_c0_g1_i2.p1  ORF type:complete len:383 (+),score=142.79 TRINITY_DN1356_c0_g1_i2:111-1259(+)